MKKSYWMTEAGYQSGERAERLHQEALRARSHMEVFADEFLLVAVLILLAGGVLGAIEMGDCIPQSPAADMNPLVLWIANRLAAFLVGFLAAFLCIGVPLTAAVSWLKKYRPALFQPRRCELRHTQAELAELLGVSQATVSLDLRRARG